MNTRRVPVGDPCKEVGDFYITPDRSAIVIRLPPPASIPAARLSLVANDDGPHWTLTGTDDAPTLEPSIHDVGRWHGWLRAGKLIAC